MSKPQSFGSFDEVPLPVLSNSMLIEIKKQYEDYYNESFGTASSKGLYSNHDWRRIQYCINLIEADKGSALDVGVGPAALLNFLNQARQFDQVTGIDVRRYSKLLLLDESIDYRIMDATKMIFNDESYDTVICMEVLEHLTLNSMIEALSELRRVAKKKLIMSVPFEEPEPLPSYHKQRFDQEKLIEYFPNAEIKLLQRPKRKGWPWAIMVEQF
ncbi:bifunctional 3-demethylubiquinone-9 3-methyltransferase/ 2-octaprenyl-6-hydroxy phenol methylase [Roseibium album]|nr:bifunctional 3-demethylubiquinone-9 3-methyltransferase/ 2-octaprenyl-6-hydroxy phenol methylase [Roseibium album]